MQCNVTVDLNNNSRSIILASGTPLSNTILTIILVNTMMNALFGSWLLLLLLYILEGVTVVSTSEGQAPWLYVYHCYYLSL